MKPKLEYGTHGDSVSEAQAKLNALLPTATPRLALDGKYGAKTVQRVKQLQQSRGLVADGIVGAKTWAVLDGTLPPKPTGAPTGPANPTHAATRVKLGAKVVSSCGSQTGHLLFGTSDGRTIANVRDFPMTTFGKCHSLYNGKVQAYTQLHQGVFSPQPYTPVYMGSWSPGAPLEFVGTPPAAALGTSSVMVCGLGGLISIVDKGK